MQIPIWKKWWSYIRDIHIESLESEHNGTLDVFITKGRYQLCTQDAIYSYDDKYDNFVKGFNQINWDQYHPKNALILGLGLGSIPYIMEHTLGKVIDYTAVEIDEAVVDLVSTYTLPRLKSYIEIICADAFIYVQNCQQQYDMVLLDVFISDKIPTKFQSEGFYEMLGQLIAPNGILMVNRLAMTTSDRQASQENFIAFSKVFPNATNVDVHNNFIFFHDRLNLNT